MEKWLALFAAILLLGNIEGSHYRGTFITWVINQTDFQFFPANPNALYVKVHFKHGAAWRRSDGSATCTSTSIATCKLFSHVSWNIYYGYSEYSQPYKLSALDSNYYCEKYSTDKDFNIGSKWMTRYLEKTKTYLLKTSTCCWVSGLRTGSSSSWHAQAMLSFKPRSNYVSGGNNKLNTPPQIDHIPIIQHYYYRSSGYTHYRLPITDPDGDKVKCRWARNSTEGGGMYNSRPFVLSENCVVSFSQNGYYGWQGATIMVEDYAYDWVSYKWKLLSTIPLQFLVNVFTTYSSSGSYRVASVYGQNRTTCRSSSTPRPPSTPYPITVPTTSKIQALDGCKYYQVLGDKDRSVAFSDWSSYRCDNELYGWYRFMGQAGNRMALSCPNKPNVYSYKCGSYYQGWIPSGGLPAAYQGAVSTNVCFSRYGTCSCSYTKTIKVRNCGTFHIYWLDKPTVCNARYCGMKDNSTIVSCSKNYMRIDLNRIYYNTSLYSSITLRHSQCPATYTNDYISVGSKLGSCGSTRRDTASEVIYENEVVFKAAAPNGMISREFDQKITFACVYNRHGQSSSPFVSVGYRPISSVNATEVGYGNFTFNFMMYTDKHYSRMHTYYPVSVQLRDWIYFEVQSTTSDKNSVVLIDHCYSTPTMDRNHEMKYFFISNRCPNDHTVQFHTAANNRQRFSLQAFRYLKNSTAVFIHCLVFMCHKSSPDSRCKSGCQGNNVNRVRRDVDQIEQIEDIKYYLLEREVRLAEPRDNSHHKSDQHHVTGVAIGASIGCFLLICLVAGLVVKLRLQSKRLEANASVGMENRGMEPDVIEKSPVA